MKPSRLLLKLGGATLGDPATLTALKKVLPKLMAQYSEVFLVHGGGPRINARLEIAGLTWEFINGQRVTTEAMIQIVADTLVNEVNKSLVGELVESGIRAVAVSGAENQTLLCRPLAPELGRVGVVEKVNTESLLALASDGLPVIAPIAVDSEGALFNVNADWAAAQIAAQLKVDRLIFLTDQLGVLDGNKELIHEMSIARLPELVKSGIVAGGMLAKLSAVETALRYGVRQVEIIKGHLAEELTGTSCVGTQIALESKALLDL